MPSQANYQDPPPPSSQPPNGVRIGDVTSDRFGPTNYPAPSPPPPPPPSRPTPPPRPSAPPPTGPTNPNEPLLTTINVPSNESGLISLDEGEERNVGNYYPNNPPPPVRGDETSQFIVDQVTNVPDAPTPTLLRETVYSNKGQVIGVGVNQKAVIFSRGSVIDSDFLEARRNSKESVDLAATYAAEKKTNEISIDIKNLSDGKGFSADGDFTTVGGLLDFPEYDAFGGEISLDEVKWGNKTVGLLQKENLEVFKNEIRQLNRHLHDRAWIKIQNANNIVYIPFFENPQIEEKRGITIGEIPIAGQETLNFPKGYELLNVRITLKLNVVHIAEMLRTEGDATDNLVNIDSLKILEGTTGTAEDFFSDSMDGVPVTRIGLRSRRSDENVIYSDRDTKTVADTSFNVFDQDMETKIVPSKKYQIKLRNHSSEFKTFVRNVPSTPIETFNIPYGGGSLNPDGINYYAPREEKNYYERAQAKVLSYLNSVKQFSSAIPIQRDVATGKILNPPKFEKQIVLNYPPLYENVSFNLRSYEIRESNAAKTYDVETLMCNNYELVLFLLATKVSEGS